MFPTGLRQQKTADSQYSNRIAPQVISILYPVAIDVAKSRGESTG